MIQAAKDEAATQTQQTPGKSKVACSSDDNTTYRTLVIAFEKRLEYRRREYYQRCLGLGYPVLSPR